MSRPTHGRQASISLLPPPTQAFLTQIHGTSIPYVSLPAIPTQIVLLSNERYTFTYLGVTAIGDSPYRHFSLWDGWMEREWSVYALDATKSALKRTGSLSSTSTASSATAQWYTTGKDRAVKNDEVRNALTAAFLQTISRSLPSIEIVI